MRLLAAAIRWGSAGPLMITSLAIMGSPGPATISLTAAGSAYGVRRSVAYLVGIIVGTVMHHLADRRRYPCPLSPRSAERPHHQHHPCRWTRRRDRSRDPPLSPDHRAGYGSRRSLVGGVLSLLTVGLMSAFGREHRPSA